MAKITIKESSIRENVNSRYFEMIKTELSKFVNTKFTEMYKYGNYATADSFNIDATNFTLGNTPDTLEYYINNTLNYRYENFSITYVKF
jgi:hypothetical protein